MLRAYSEQDGRLIALTGVEGGAVAPVWIDLVNPTPDEDRIVESLFAISIPSRAEMEEIELSARLYHDEGAEFMTITALTGLDGDAPVKTPVTFILKDTALITVRYADPRPFQAFTGRALKGSLPCSSGERVMLGIVEAMIDRDADALERAGNEIDAISHDVFKERSARADQRQADLRSVIEQIGRKDDLLSKIQESLVSISRMVTYHATTSARQSKEGRLTTKQIQRDAQSLGDHARALSGKIVFLLDATLGLINLEQNQIIKLFSVAAVVFLPPTLVASIYGMNFDFMPELSWPLGYPFALGLMVLSAVLPYLYFKRRGWL